MFFFLIPTSNKRVVATNSGFFKLNFFSVTHSKHLATYDVQDAEICGEKGSIYIRCVFASGSQAKGCHVKIQNFSININDTSMNISRSGDSQSQTVTIAPGSYEVLIFDWEKNGSVASTPSYVGHVNVTDIPITNSFSPTMTTTVTRPDPSPTNGRMTTIVAIATK